MQEHPLSWGDLQLTPKRLDCFPGWRIGKPYGYRLDTNSAGQDTASFQRIRESLTDRHDSPGGARRPAVALAVKAVAPIRGRVAMMKSYPDGTPVQAGQPDQEV